MPLRRKFWPMWKDRLPRLTALMTREHCRLPAAQQRRDALFDIYLVRLVVPTAWPLRTIAPAKTHPCEDEPACKSGPAYAADQWGDDYCGLPSCMNSCTPSLDL